MFSYGERSKTFLFKGWPTVKNRNAPHLLGMTGFICNSVNIDLAVIYPLCKKLLEGWEKKDVPVAEHHDHKKECILYSPHLLNNQKI